MCIGRAKTAMGCEVTGVGRCREIATGSVAICGSRAKISVSCVMLVGSRKIAYRYVMISVGCSVDYYGLFLIAIKCRHLKGSGIIFSTD